jgi:hypothetical protein
VVGEFAALIKSYGLRSVTGDRYAGEYPRELFRKLGIAYELSDRLWKGDWFHGTFRVYWRDSLVVLALVAVMVSALIRWPDKILADVAISVAFLIAFMMCGGRRSS